MKHFRLFSLLTILVFLASSAYAQNPPPKTVQTKSVLPVPGVEATGIRHAFHSTGPIVVNWHIKKTQGLANLVVNPDGTFLFSGNYKPAKPGKVLDLVLVLKSHVGATYLFRYMGNASGGGIKWSEPGQSTILKEDFKLFSPGHEWAGTYRFHLTAEAKKIAREDEKQACAQIANLINYGGGDWIGFPKYCQQFNANWRNW